MLSEPNDLESAIGSRCSDLLRAFAEVTGWQLLLESQSQSPFHHQTAWQAPIPDPFGGAGSLLVLTKDSEVRSPQTSRKRAVQLAEQVAGLLQDICRLEYALVQREAELATAVPVVSREADEASKLATRLRAVFGGVVPRPFPARQRPLICWTMRRRNSSCGPAGDCQPIGCWTPPGHYREPREILRRCQGNWWYWKKPMIWRIGTSLRNSPRLFVCRFRRQPCRWERCGCFADDRENSRRLKPTSSRLSPDVLLVNWSVKFCCVRPHTTGPAKV